MKAFELKRIAPPPPPPEPKLCVACKGFRAECIVPVGEGSAPMCWLCAHHVADHECAIHDAATAECECLPHEIYPGRQAPTVDELIAERMRFQHGDVDYTKPRSKDELLRGAFHVLGFPASPEALHTVRIIRAARETWEDDQVAERSRGTRSICSVCDKTGHYPKTCPTIVRRGR